MNNRKKPARHSSQLHQSQSKSPIPQKKPVLKQTPLKFPPKNNTSDQKQINNSENNNNVTNYRKSSFTTPDKHAKNHPQNQQLQVCLTGFEGQEKTYLTTIVKDLGGTYCDNMTDTVNVVVANNLLTQNINLP